MMDSKTAQFLESFHALGSIPGTDGIRRLLFRLGNPQDQLNIVHLAGTNGKGSVGTIMAGILMYMGYEVGRYTSPAVFDELEIISLNGKNITSSDFARVVSVVGAANQSLIDEGNPSCTRFEIETAAMFLYFAEIRPDYVLIECGMGGLMDATNVVDRPLLSVITRIDYDHMSFLGNTLQEIATHKAGILKPGCPGIVLDSCDMSSTAIQDYAGKIGATISFTKPNTYQIIQQGGQGILCGQLDGFDFVCVLPTNLRASYQAENLALGIQASSMLLAMKERALTMNDLRQAISTLSWPGRFELIHCEPDVIMDGAHNPSGALGLRDSLALYYPNQPYTLVIGVFADKDYQTELDLLLPQAKHVCCIETPNHPRALHASTLAEFILLHYDITVQAYENIEECLSELYKNATKDSLIVVCGSLSHLRYVRSFTAKYQEKHHDR